MCSNIVQLPHALKHENKASPMVLQNAARFAKVREVIDVLQKMRVHGIFGGSRLI